MMILTRQAFTNSLHKDTLKIKLQQIRIIPVEVAEAA